MKRSRKAVKPPYLHEAEGLINQFRHSFAFGRDDWRNWRCKQKQSLRFVFCNASSDDESLQSIIPGRATGWRGIWALGHYGTRAWGWRERFGSLVHFTSPTERCPVGGPSPLVGWPDKRLTLKQPKLFSLVQSHYQKEQLHSGPNNSLSKEIWEPFRITFWFANELDFSHFPLFAPPSSNFLFSDATGSRGNQFAYSKSSSRRKQSLLFAITKASRDYLPIPAPKDVPIPFTTRMFYFKNSNYLCQNIVTKTDK